MADPEKKKRKKECAKKSSIKNREREKKQKKEYNKRECVKERRRKQHHERKLSDIEYVLKRRLRCRLRSAIKRVGITKYEKGATMKLAGCNSAFLKIHLEKTFTDGMCWERVSEMDVDHIIPCFNFDLTKLEEQKKCFHYSNLQMLWREDNLKKNRTYPYNIT